MLPDLSDRYVIPHDPGQFFLKLRLPEDVYCDQCILQVMMICKLIKIPKSRDGGRWTVALLL